MPLVPAICERCGAALQVDPQSGMTVCEHCQTPFFTLDAINSYSIASASINTQTVVVGTMQSDFEIRAGELLNYRGSGTRVRIPSGIVRIAAAFKDCFGLESVEIPDSVEEIGPSAFEGCRSLAEVTIPSGVESIGALAFARCRRLRTVHFMGENTSIDARAFEASPIETVTAPEPNRADICFCIPQDVPGHVQDNVLTVPGAYRRVIRTSMDPTDFVTFREVRFLQGVQVIEANTFSACYPSASKIERVFLPEGLERIGESAFEGVQFIEDLNVPSSVKSIDSRAFADCINLMRVDFASPTTKCGLSAFDLTWAKNDRCRFCGEKLGYFRRTCKACKRAN